MEPDHQQPWYLLYNWEFHANFKIFVMSALRCDKTKCSLKVNSKPGMQVLGYISRCGCECIIENKMNTGL